MTEEEREALRKKVTAYRHAHREHINAYARQRRLDDPKRVRDYEKTRTVKRKIWKEENKEKIRLLGKLYREKIKLEVIQHYSPEKCCVKCGIADIDVLTIDHINGKGHQHRKMLGGGGAILYCWLRKNNYPEGYQVLCLNCNWKKHLQELRNAAD